MQTILPLKVLVLKAIAKQPNKKVFNEETLKRAKLIESNPSFDLCQTLIDYITEAGRLTDDVIPMSLFLSNRTKLSFKNSKVSGKYIIKIINCCKNITELDISGTFQVDDQTILQILIVCQHINHLIIRNCRKITDKTLESICSHNCILQSLDIGGNSNLTSHGIKNFISSYKHTSMLTVFNVSGLPIDDELLRLISHRFHNLKSLGIGYADIEEQSLKNLLDTIGSNLESLSIPWVERKRPDGQSDSINSTFISEYLGRSCPKLKFLDISGLKMVNQTCLSQYIEFKISQAEQNPKDYENICGIKAKFIGSSKASLEAATILTYPQINFEY